MNSEQIKELLANHRDEVLEEAAKAAESVCTYYGGIAEGPFATDFGKHTHQSMANGALSVVAVIRNLKSDGGPTFFTPEEGFSA